MLRQNQSRQSTLTELILNKNNIILFIHTYHLKCILRTKEKNSYRVKMLTRDSNEDVNHVCLGIV